MPPSTAAPWNSAGPVQVQFRWAWPPRRMPHAATLACVSIGSKLASTYGGTGTLTQFDTTLDLHERLLTDLVRRDAAVAEQEAEARRALEQALAHCAAEHASIDQDRVLLMQVGQLYRRFIEANGGKVPEPDAVSPKLTAQASPSKPEQDAGPRVDRPTLVDSSIESQIATTIRGLRSQLIAEQEDARAA